jgi:hypothetical protein
MSQAGPTSHVSDALKEQKARWDELCPRLAKDPEATLDRVFRGIAASGLPVVAGPWLSEVGFELLYWIPMLNWAAEKYGIAKDRITAVSRGGVDAWYSSTAGGYWDIFGLMTADEYRAKNEARRAVYKTQKQVFVSDLDLEILAAFLKARNVGRFEWIHPLCMYLLFEAYWKSRQGLAWVADHTRYKPIPRPAGGAVPGLPEDYVAVKFYFSKAFPKTAENARFITRTLVALTGTGPVVLLNTGLSLDDHSELAPQVKKRLVRVDGLMTAENNLRVQSQVIAGAKAFYGTYGGFSYLAPFMNVPSFSFYSAENTLHLTHLDAAYRACRMLKYGSFDGIKLKADYVPQGSDFLAMHVRQAEALNRLAYRKDKPGRDGADPFAGETPLWRRAARRIKRLVVPPPRLPS